ncbi:Methylcrotonyl-CoA carboxylase biotin-containing subunit [[Actinomadura] parvosata subsp. kistnae]|nr:Methylcrotonyl-CoA carboxylase biotin-containing subunit [Actinomadura parvosata subsp. kistnae]
MGWAVEARLYAEDSGHVPQAGVLRRFEIPGGVRVDAGVESGSVVSPHYDALLAKVVAHGSTRAEAVRKLVSALRGARLHGLTTNRDLLVDILTNRDFVAGDTHTGFLDPDGPLQASPVQMRDGQEALAAALAMAALNRSRARVLAGLPAGWRNVRSQPRAVRFEETGEVTYDPLPEGVAVVAADQYRVVLEQGGLRRTYEIAHYPGSVCVDHAGGHAELTPVPRLPEPSEHVAPGSLLAPMPGSVLRVEVEPGDRVVKGQAVLVLEAMKMEHVITAPAGGVVSGVHVEKGRQVDAGAVLAIIQEGDS